MSATKHRFGGTRTNRYDSRRARPVALVRLPATVSALPLFAMMLAALAIAMTSGCGAKKSRQDCSQAVAGQSCSALAHVDAKSTKGTSDNGGNRDQASSIDDGQGTDGTAASGGTANNGESTGTGRAVRDRRGLADAWPAVPPTTRHLTARYPLSNG